MGDCYGTPGAAGMVLDIDAAKWTVDQPPPPLLVVVWTACGASTRSATIPVRHKPVIKNNLKSGFSLYHQFYNFSPPNLALVHSMSEVRTLV